ncbi:MAG TPA: SUMF1/EgtB/PvdO family nonheme iron enzyme [Thermoanaerobaculia bacterium]|nr:SUMF1/EgtB/PvdO family nonheme iron enzyme [Thermoanaerobaculia bacterium]
MTRRPSYTDYPRTILWLIPGGSVELDGGTFEIEPFYLSKWPITNEQLRAFDAAYQPAAVSPGPRDVAVGVDWDQAHAYCEWYAEVARKPMRLPSEVEWLHACRGGNGSRDEEAALARSPGETGGLHGIGGLDPRLARDFGRINGFGLHGMTGGVWEWMAAPGSGSEPEGGGSSHRVLRGGSFRIDPSELSCALRREVERTHRADDVGFRVAKSLR